MTKGEYESRIQTTCLAILTIIALAITLKLLATVLVPFILASLLTLILLPIVDFLIRKLRIGRPIALVLTLFLGFLSLFGVGTLVYTSVGQFMNNASEYEQQLTKMVAKVENSINVDKIPSWVFGKKSANPEDSVTPEDTEQESTTAAVNDENSPVEPDSIAVSSAGVDSSGESSFDASSLLPASTIRSIVKQTSTVVLSGLKSMFGTVILVMLFTAFLLFGSSTRTEARKGVMGEIELRVQKYIGIKIVLSMLTGGLVFFVLQILGVDYAMSFGAFAFILNFVPNVGSIIATALPIPVVLVTPEVSMMTVALAILLPLTVQVIIGNIIEPKIMGDTLGLHPVVILMALIFWGMLWGLPGMLLAAPMTAIAKIIFERIERWTRFEDILDGVEYRWIQ